MNLKALQSHIKTICTDSETRIILEDIAGVTTSDLITAADKAISESIITKIQSILAQRAAGKPLSKILGYKEFYGHTFKVTEHTLDPRPETEILIDHALALIKPIAAPQILDLGTGTACIPLSILCENKAASATAVDISPDALAVAKENAANNPRIQFIQSDWFENVQGQFDLITANPPYIDSAEIANLSSEVKNHDPILALDGGKNGLDPYKIIFSQIKKYLKPAGRGLFEIGYDQCGYISRLAEKYRIRIEAIHPDLAGIPRVVEISCGDK
jgi:release factor glutamine methyltransferase